MATSGATSVAGSLLGALAVFALAACSDPATVRTEPKLELAPQSLDFGEVPVLNVVTRTLELKNVGRAPLTVESVQVQEAGVPFAVVSASQSVGAGEAGSAVVAFTPGKLAPYSATLAVTTDDLEQPVVLVPLTGQGSTVAKVEADPALDFGVVCEGAEAVKSLRLRSIGTAALIVEEIRLAEGTSPEFRFVSSTKTPVTVPPGGELSLTLRVSAATSSADRLLGAVLVTGTDPDHRTISIPLSAQVNRAPVAAIGEPANAAPGATVQLDGSGSSDLDGNLPLAYEWSLKSSPLGSRSQPTPLDQAATELTLDLPGQYRVALQVTDTQGCRSLPFYQEVIATPAQQLVVELVWNSLDPDLDLHMVPSGSAFFGPEDCFYKDGHERPDWGVKGDASDDPVLGRDALTGYGPELIEYATPAPGRYEVMVHYFNDHHSDRPSSLATVRVYEFGVVKAEVSRTVSAEGREWRVLSIDWPSGAITQINVLE
ncbi:MAG: choice-of-anchor D domain-containing protein [Deltaproteobacteria bacterium]|nr:choice-of-anchor D domain-containing protein [Deltaproteobacteria bacterium]